MNDATLKDVCLYEAGVTDGRLEGIRLGLEAAADVWVDLSKGRPDAVDAVIAMRVAIRAITPSDVLKGKS